MISKESLSTWILGLIAQTLAMLIGSTFTMQFIIVCITGVFGILASAISTYLKFYLITKANRHQKLNSGGDVNPIEKEED